MICTRENDDLTKEEANELLKDNNFALLLLNITMVSLFTQKKY